MKLCILIVSAVFPPEPIVSAKLSMDIVDYLVKAGRSVTVFHPEPTRPYGFKFVENNDKDTSYNNVTIPSYTSPRSGLMGRLWESYSFGRHSAKYIKQFHEDLSCIYVNAWPLFAQALIVRTAKRYKVPCVVHVQDIYPESFTNKVPIGSVAKLMQWVLLPIDKYILSGADHILAISENMKKHLVDSRQIGEEKITVVENWQNENEFITYHRSEHLQDEMDALTFMYLGNIGPVAGVEFLIDSFANAHIESARLVIAGSGSKKNACMELAESYPEACIEFWDVPNGKVPEIQDKADIMLLPVKKGGAMSSIPSKLPAYMFSRKPIIGALDRESDTAKAILAAACGWVVEPENEHSLINTMKNAANHTSTDLEKMGNNGFEYAMKRFSKKHNLSLIIRAIKSCIN